MHTLFFSSSWDFWLQECWSSNPIESNTEAFCFLIGSHGWRLRVALTQTLCAYFFASSKWQRYSYAMCSFLFSSIKSASICLWSARKEKREKWNLIGGCRNSGSYETTALCFLCLSPVKHESRGSVTKVCLPKSLFGAVAMPLWLWATPTVSRLPANSNSSLHTC